MSCSVHCCCGPQRPRGFSLAELAEKSPNTSCCSNECRGHPWGQKVVRGASMPLQAWQGLAAHVHSVLAIEQQLLLGSADEYKMPPLSLSCPGQSTAAAHQACRQQAPRRTSSSGTWHKFHSGNRQKSRQSLSRLGQRWLGQHVVRITRTRVLTKERKAAGFHPQAMLAQEAAVVPLRGGGKEAGQGVN